ncbi:MAG: hypothetical protein MPN21_20590 [Thermoanaerobaculia bacterium]|nr:hypothetical protein [Thermoanaerobaculia bacterium]
MTIRPRFHALVGLLLLVLTAVAAAAPSREAVADSPARWAPGQEGLSAGDLRPFRATFQQTAGGAEAGRRTVSLERELGPDGISWHYVIAIETSATVHDELTFLQADFQPRLRRVSLPGRLQRVEVWRDFESAVVAVMNGAGDVEQHEIAAAGPRFPSAALDLMTALHGLGDATATRKVPVYSSDFGPAGDLWIESVLGDSEEIEAVGRTFRVRQVKETVLDAAGEPLTMPDGSPFPAFRKWLTPEPPYLVKAEYGPLKVELETLTVFGP